MRAVSLQPQADAAAKELRAAFDLCKPHCTCGVVPCPHEKMQLCTTCGDIKKLLCRKGPCVAAREPLRLTMRTEPLQLTMGEEAA